MYKCLVILIIYIGCSALSAQNNHTDTDKLSSLIIKVKGTTNSDYCLQNIKTNQIVPILDLSRQMMIPGSYKLTFKKWGYHKYESQFILDNDTEKEVTFVPVKVDDSLMKSYQRRSIQSNVFLVTTIVAISSAVASKIIGDSEYRKYRNSTNADEITKYRKSSNQYQIAFISTSSLSLGSVTMWLISIMGKRNADHKITQEMNTLAP